MITIRTEFQLTQRGWYLCSSLRLDIVEFAERLLQIHSTTGSQILKFGGSSNEFYWTKANPEATPIDPLAWVEDLLERRKDLLKNAEFGEFFRLKRVLVQVNDFRFDYRMNAIGEWVAQ